MLNKNDLNLLDEYGISREKIYAQLETFSLGIPTADIVTAASIGNGIEKIEDKNQEKLIAFYEEKKPMLDIVKFVPASGAATRMFRFLYEFIEIYDPAKETFSSFMKRSGNEQLERFFTGINEFAFIGELRKKIREMYPDFKRSKKGDRMFSLVKTMLDEDGLNFSNLPKGLIPFHKYNKYYTTAFEEQLYEAAFYATSRNDAYVHFTFSEAHLSFFKDTFDSVRNRVTKKTKTKFHISYSFQKKETDTVAVTMDNKPFRDTNGNLVLRPSGHGALLSNLNDIDADIIFVKNIDNVVAQEHVEKIAHYKKLLAGKLLWIQQKVFHYLEQLDLGNEDENLIKDIRSFLWNELSIKDIPFSAERLKMILDRPIRVCGVVPNTGAPGGGPFWVKSEAGDVSLQIVETAQIEMDDPRKQAIVKDATHFNPVDIVCAVRNYKGHKYDLQDFTDPNSGFITEKSEGGEPIKALELPGLWNGSMAKWNTAFVEIPGITFNPVKTVNDLLNSVHRPNS